MSPSDLDTPPGEPEAPNLEAEVQEAEAALEADVGALLSERDELRALAQRVQADFENYRKRVQREQAALGERATEQLVEGLLPALDSFELALVNLADADEKVRKGIELAYTHLLGVLERHGLERIVTDGVAFDPSEHEAVLQEGTGEGVPVVSEVMRTGYRMKGRVVRPAMVKVSHA